MMAIPLQQCLPLAVLKLNLCHNDLLGLTPVATVLTACGIETWDLKFHTCDYHCVATVLTACGIETYHKNCFEMDGNRCNSAYRLRY